MPQPKGSTSKPKTEGKITRYTRSDIKEPRTPKADPAFQRSIQRAPYRLAETAPRSRSSLRIPWCIGSIHDLVSPKPPSAFAC